MFRNQKLKMKHYRITLDCVEMVLKQKAKSVFRCAVIVLFIPYDLVYNIVFIPLLGVIPFYFGYF